MLWSRKLSRAAEVAEELRKKKRKKGELEKGIIKNTKSA